MCLNLSIGCYFVVMTEHAAYLAVRGHGVSSECVQAQFRESQNFFALDLEEKLKIKVSTSMTTVLSISNKPPFLVGTTTRCRCASYTLK